MPSAYLEKHKNKPKRKNDNIFDKISGIVLFFLYCMKIFLRKYLSYFNFPDVSIGDFADVAKATPTYRVRKSQNSRKNMQSRLNFGRPSLEKYRNPNCSIWISDQESLQWFDKDWDELEVCDDSHEEEEDEKPLKMANRRRRYAKSSNLTVDDGVVYAVDVWFLIGQFVDPEDVVRFALICRGAHFVTHSVRFWVNLYERWVMHRLYSIPFISLFHRIYHDCGNGMIFSEF